MKAVIADDEKWVLEVIKKLGCWEECGIDIMGEAIDGKHALRLILEKKPDLIVTDICMPGIDGLELISKTLAALPNAKFIIISGYQNFNYAQQAVKLGVQDYILKPVDEDELNDALRRFSNEWKSNNAKEEKLKQQIEHSGNIIKENYLKKILSGALYEDNAHPDELNLHFNGDCFRVMELKVDPCGSSKENNKELILFLLNKSDNLASQLLKPLCQGVELLRYPMRQVIILNYNREHSRKIEKCIDDYFFYIRSQAVFLGKYYLTLGVGHEVESLNSINESWERARIAVRKRIIFGSDHLYFEDQQKQENRTVPVLLANERLNHFALLIELFDFKAVEEFIHKEFSYISDSNCNNPDVYYAFSEKIADCFLTAIDNMHLQDHLDANCKENLLNDIDNCESAESLKKKIIQFVSENMFKIYKIVEKRSVRPIAIAKEYIAAHFADELTLAEVAGAAGFNATYFSSLFKDETGVTYLEYITNYRIQIAKGLLKNTSLTTAEIAEKVGYHDSKHFSRIFKKHTGVNPSVYRNYYY